MAVRGRGGGSCLTNVVLLPFHGKNSTHTNFKNKIQLVSFTLCVKYYADSTLFKQILGKIYSLHFSGGRFAPRAT